MHGSQRNLSSSQFYSFAYCFYKQFRLREIALEREPRSRYIRGMHILMVLPFLLFINAAGARRALASFLYARCGPVCWSFIVVKISSTHHY